MIQSYDDLAKKQKYIDRFDKNIRAKELALTKAQKAFTKAKEELANAKSEADRFIQTGELPKRMQPKPKKSENSDIRQ